MTAHPRWSCPTCGSKNVQIALPTWHRESLNGDLQFVEVDSEAEPLWWYCEDCYAVDDGSPTDLKD
jgi:hypothetical protein